MQTDSPIVVLVSANAEWDSVLQIILPSDTNSSPFGDFFEYKIDGFPVIFLHSGWGKITTAGACQFAIDKWQPPLLINIGTCGGLENLVKVGEIILVNETAVYDIYELMSNYAQALDYYRAYADLSWLPVNLPANTRKARLVSADQDIQTKNYDLISQQFGAVAADWESGAFAWVAARNRIPWLILRGVTDLSGRFSSETTDNVQLWRERLHPLMTIMFDQLPWYIHQFVLARLS